MSSDFFLNKAVPRSVTLARERRLQKAEQAKLQKQAAWKDYPLRKREDMTPAESVLEKMLFNVASPVVREELRKSLQPQLDVLAKIKAATDDLHKRIEVLQNQPAPSRMAKMDAGHQGTLHKSSHAENMAAGEEQIIDEYGERHEAAELIKSMHAEGSQLFKNE